MVKLRPEFGLLISSLFSLEASWYEIYIAFDKIILRLYLVLLLNYKPFLGWGFFDLENFLLRV